MIQILSPSESDLLSLVSVDATSNVVHLDLGHPVDPAIGDIIDLGLQLSKLCLTCLNSEHCDFVLEEHSVQKYVHDKFKEFANIYYLAPSICLM